MTLGVWEWHVFYATYEFFLPLVFFFTTPICLTQLFSTHAVRLRQFRSR